MQLSMANLSAVYRAYPSQFWVLWVGTLINRLGEFVVPLLGFTSCRRWT
ncbi:hypothetical protein ACFSC4_14995 [Deinococcus malanensis]